MLYIIYAAWNTAVFLLYGIDKYKSMHNNRRISEKTLLSAAFLMGGIGAFAGMKFFHHKTKKQRFCVLVPLAIVVNVILMAYGKGYVYG